MAWNPFAALFGGAQIPHLAEVSGRHSYTSNIYIGYNE